MELEELLPQKPEFFVSKMGKTYALRPPNMADQVWFRDRYGKSDKFEKALEEQDWPEIARVAYYLLEDEGKRDFLAGNLKVIDGEGVERTIHHSGPEKLLVALSGLKEMLEVMQAITRAIVISNPVAEAVAKKMLREEVKRDPDLLKKARETGPLPRAKTGPKASISSVRSTDRRSKRSRS